MPSADLETAARPRSRRARSTTGSPASPPSGSSWRSRSPTSSSAASWQGMEALRRGRSDGPGHRRGPARQRGPGRRPSHEQVAAVGGGRRAAADRRPPPQAAGILTIAPTVLTGHQPGTPRLHRGDLRAGRAAVPRAATSTRRSASPTIRPSVWAASAWTQDAAERDAVHRGARGGHGVHQRDGGLRSPGAVRRGQAVGLRARAQVITASASSSTSRRSGSRKERDRPRTN